jgi:hypothetical protein
MPTLKHSACLGVAIALTLIGVSAKAALVSVKDGRFEADVSAHSLTRIAIAGEKVATVRKVDDGQGPKMSVDIDAATGDLFVEFDGDVVGRTFTAFLTTQSGKTVEAVLSPRDGEGQTVFVHLAGTETAASPSQGGDDQPQSTPDQGQGTRQEGYPQLLTALVRVMFNEANAPGVERRALTERPRPAGAFEVQAIETYEVGDLKGTVLSVHNLSQVGQPLGAKVFLTAGVLAAAVSHETVAPGAFARIYLVEGVQP